MAKHPSEIIARVLRNAGYIENTDGTFTHPYEQKLKNSPLERIRRCLRQQEKLKQ